jgi:hypothetical protein
MTKMKPLLIDENSQRAESEIREHKNQARLLSELIQHYNRLPHLGEIDTAVEAREFLSDPLGYLNTCIYNQLATGMFSTKVKPEASKIAELYSIPYPAIMQRINGVRPYLRNLDRFAFDEGNRTLVLLPEGEEAIRAACKIYLTNEAEIEEYNKLKTVAESLNEVFLRFCSTGVDINTAAHALPFLRAVPGSKAGENWKLMPDVTFVKKLAKTA